MFPFLSRAASSSAVPQTRLCFKSLEWKTLCVCVCVLKKGGGEGVNVLA